jgi:hypothetical protein
MIQSISDVLKKGPKVSNWHDSEKTREMVAQQIEERWGKSEVKNYDPERNCLPFTTWLNLGFRPKKGSKALKSVTFIERRDNEGNIISKFPRAVCLFYYRDVIKEETAKNHE